MDEQRRRTSSHEAGHVLVAYDAGVSVIAASVRPVPPMGGWTSLGPDPEHWWDIAAIALAGQLAERVLSSWTPSREPQDEPWFNEREFELAFLLQADPVWDQRVIDALGLSDRVVHAVRRRTAASLRNSWKVLEAVASKLYVGGCVDGRDLVAVIRKESQWMS